VLNAELVDAGIFGSMPRFGSLCVHAIVDLRRAFSRAELERAAQATVRDFPVLGLCYEPRLFRDRWVSPPGAPALVEVVDEPRDLEAETLARVTRPLEPTREPPLHVVSLARPNGGSRLVLTLSHLAMDGGGMAAAGHVFGSHLYGVRPSAPVDPRRSVAHALDGLRWFHAPALARDLARAALQPLRTWRGGERERPYPRDGVSPPRFRHVVLAAADVTRLKARAPGASVNDLLVAALARVAAGRSSRGPVPILYTMDLRRFGASARLTTANTSSILTALVPRGATRDLVSATRAVAAITARQRRSLDGPAFVLLPILMSGLAPHGLLRQLIRGIHPIAVELPLRRGMLVTNVGKIDDGLAVFGDDIEDVRVVGPHTRDVPIPAVVAFGFRGRLCLELYAPAGLGDLALDELEHELRAALELAPPGDAKTEARAASA
jgi:NRPS condensation-like uncharacterized protein